MTRDVPFTKMSASGNDFVVVAREHVEPLGADPAAWVRRVCRRRLSLGADGVLMVAAEAPGRVRVEFRNPDGTEAFCGNGTRCAARFARIEGMAGETMILETAVGTVKATVRATWVELVLPPPRDLGEGRWDAGGEEVRGRRVDAGVPHVVVAVPEVSRAPLERWGPNLRRNPRFGPAGTNVDVWDGPEPGVVRLRTWERGVEGETLACGSGAVAAALDARLAGAPERVRVIPASGVELTVRLPGPAGDPSAAMLGGDARVVCQGTLSGEATAGFPAP